MNKTKTILIVDDDADFVESLSVCLESHGFRVIAACDGGEGLKLARMEDPDLVIMDIVMNERTEGFFTIREMRRDSRLQDVPIFVLSSLYSDNGGFQVQPEAGWLAHDEFMPKPPDVAELIRKIDEHVGTREASK